MHPSYVLATFAMAQAAFATPHMLESRAEERTRCETPQECSFSYTTGSTQCQSGYMKSRLEAQGDPSGSYCQRTCTADERKSCNADACERYERDCNMYPRSGPACSSAITWCDGPVSMLNATCTSEQIGQAVTYDEEKRLCIPKGKAADSRRAAPLRLGPGANFIVAIYDPSVTDQYHQLRCFDLSYQGAKFLAEKAEGETNNCTTVAENDQGDSGYDFVFIKCETSEKKWDHVKDVVAQTCYESKPYGHSGPYYNWQSFPGQP